MCTMNCLTSTCYVCLKTKDKSLVNINSSLSANKDILHILGYLPCNLAWLKTKAIVLICEECCLRLRETYLFLAMCLTNSVVLRGYMDKLNTACGSHADNETELRTDFNTEHDENSEMKCGIKLEPEATVTEETVDALVNVEETWVQTFSSIKIEDPCEEVDGNEESLIDNNSTGSGSEQVHQQYQSSGESGLVRGKKHKKLDSSVNRNEDTSGDSTIAKKNKKGTGNSAGKECAGGETEMRAGKSVKEILPKKAYKQYLKDLAEYKRWMNPQEQQQQEQQQQQQQQQEERQQQRQLQKEQRKLLKKYHRKQKKLQKSEKKAFRHLLH